ncbi:hypothetical protein [Bombella saccharophila]|uniref:Tetratricopeptide repeat protein n=1 Tax=Bombella saccharophila TaxID=2967338 RepID=A0ABT3W737_9PROT|nr:hypothetical protein [Bombella saccharophila]MCX5614194.1 hypothetical protein [Bombella saccharophila]
MRSWLLPGFALFIVGALAGCFGGGGDQKGWNDPRYKNAMDVGNSIFSLEHIKPARQQYKAALDRALLANNTQAIYDAGFNLALSELRLKAFQDCLATVQKVMQALTVRGWTDAQQAGLHLIRASVFYEQRRWHDSLTEANLARNSRDSDIQAEAYAVAGLDAAILQDRPQLEESITHLSTSHDLRDKTNLRELLVYRELMDQQWQRAADDAHSLAQSREEALNYESMRRALRLQAQALEAMGQKEEARNLLQQVVDSQKTQSTP